MAILLANKKVLVMDDDADIRDLMREVLENTATPLTGEIQRIGRQ